MIMVEFLMDVCLILGVMTVLILISWIPALGLAVWVDDFSIAPFLAWTILWILCIYACSVFLGV